MPVVAVIGAQWGDEGKGKVVDLLAEEVQVVARYSGGANAGHTVVNSYGEFRLHLVPSGIFHPQATCIIGNGVVLDPAALIQEMEEIKAGGVSTDNLVINERAHLVMPYHLLFDKLEEQAKGDGAIGTTLKGIGPAYSDKAARLGIRAGDLLDKRVLLDRLTTVLEQKNKVLTRLYGCDPLSLNDIYDQCCESARRLAPHIRETESLLLGAIERGERVMLEGAQGTMLDVDFGTYPFVTSSSPSVGGACTGLGLSPRSIDGIIGVFKAYTTRVGSGPMPTELTNEVGDHIRERAKEYGATTGRPRRCGWFDAVAARYSARINGFTGVALTKLDALDELPTIKICTGYKLGGIPCKGFPSAISALAQCEPIYEEMPGWQRSTADIRRFADLPSQAQDYVRRLEELVGCPINLISVGPAREQTIITRPIF